MSSVLFTKPQTQQQSLQGAHRPTTIQQTAANNHVTLAEHRYGDDGDDSATLNELFCLLWKNE